MSQVPRRLEERVMQSLLSFPVTYIAGPRQSGKTTLTQRIASTKHKAIYLTFDDIQLRSSAQRDPDTFLHSMEGNKEIMPFGENMWAIPFSTLCAEDKN